MISDALRREFEAACGRPIEGGELLGENKYCTIWRVMMDGTPVVLKKYVGDNPALARVEGEAVEVYHRIAVGVPELIDSRRVAFSAPHNVVGVSFVPGDRLADVLLRLSSDRARWPEASLLLGIVGETLRRLYETTKQPGLALDRFHAEYIHYTSRSLAGVRVMGRVMFRRWEQEAAELVAELEKAAVVPSFAHGDLVPRNIHVQDGRVGLIDFANSLMASHPLHDMMNMWFALQNMMIDGGFRARLWDAFCDGFGPRQFPDAAWLFFWEWHRRRWLMLNLRTNDPRRLARALRGLATFARRDAAPHPAIRR